MVRHRGRVRVIVSVWVRFRVGIWDTFRLLLGEVRGDQDQDQREVEGKGGC